MWMGAAGVHQRKESVLGHPWRKPLELAVAQQAGRVQVPDGARDTWIITAGSWVLRRFMCRFIRTALWASSSERKHWLEPTWWHCCSSPCDVRREQTFRNLINTHHHHHHQTLQIWERVSQLLQHVQACEGLPGDRSDTIALEEPWGTEKQMVSGVFPSMQCNDTKPI